MSSDFYQLAYKIHQQCLGRSWVYLVDRMSLALQSSFDAGMREGLRRREAADQSQPEVTGAYETYKAMNKKVLP